MTDPHDAPWRKSSRSQQGGTCVEITLTSPDHVSQDKPEPTTTPSTQR